MAHIYLIDLKIQRASFFFNPPDNVRQKDSLLLNYNNVSIFGARLPHDLGTFQTKKNARKNILHLLEFLYYVKTLKIDKQQSMENLSVQKYGDGSSRK